MYESYETIVYLFIYTKNVYVHIGWNLFLDELGNQVNDTIYDFCTVSLCAVVNDLSKQ